MEQYHQSIAQTNEHELKRPPTQAELQNDPLAQGLKSEAEGGNKPYNPIQGNELGKVLVKMALAELYTTAGWNLGPVVVHVEGQHPQLAGKPSYADDLEHQFLRRLQRGVPALGDELLAYPRAHVKFDVGFTLYPTHYKVEYTLLLEMYPIAEGRKVKGQGSLRGGFSNTTPPLAANPQRGEEPVPVTEVPVLIQVNLDFNTDQIPPDALRVMNDLPVPTPTKLRGANAMGAGTASIVDEPKVATGKEKEAIVKEYGGKLTTKGGK